LQDGVIMKKYAGGGGIREGKSRFGDDIRKRAMKEIESRGLSDAEAAKLLDREPKKPAAEARRVPTPRKIEAKPLATGGSVSKRADGCAIRGKTRGKVM
jgi:hypothetical protein